jgi:hypothetical protein
MVVLSIANHAQGEIGDEPFNLVVLLVTCCVGLILSGGHGCTL